jgi:hypothetical protein
MATLVLGAAGAAVGGAIGGSVAGLAAPVLGRALGAVAGSFIDQHLLGGGSAAVETGRVSTLRLQGSREGTPLARVFGRARVTGTVIWASRFREHVTTRHEGGKGTAPGTTVRDYSYSVSLALALSDGPIDRIGRIWADGTEVALDSLPLRLHRGLADAAPDPLIAALEGEDAAPAFRGTAYLLFEDLPLGRWGNRVPQFAVEVFREPRMAPDASPEAAPPLADLVKAVALSPGSGEFALDSEPVLRRLSAGETVWENMNTIETRPDLLVSLDQLEEALPACRSVLLVVSWFGDDLRAGHCHLYPAVEEPEKITEPHAWSVSGVDRDAARVVGRTPEGRPVYGGTPADRSVIACIRELKARGYRVVFYPFILMDIPPGNGLPDPYGGAEQGAYPWRGRITLDSAPGQPGSPDKTSAAAAAVASFIGGAAPGDFTPEADGVSYRGPAEWSLRRMVLHYAHLCAQAGGVDAFCIGSELRSLTQIRSGPDSYPAVAALKTMARDVRSILGAGTRLGYAADWSEYFGHHPQDGSGDVFFHLDPLWSDPAIDFIGIDNYMPLTDWRDGVAHLDAAEADSIHALAYLRGNIEGGEGFDWFYASAADRAAQNRTPITDGAAAEPWVFRYKDLRHWWSLPHHDRPGGVRASAPTGWVPCSKPIWFTELGCAAIDRGANQPNVFLDAKSSESARPYFSTGAPDAYGQRRFLQAVLGYWDDGESNPHSPIYGGPMIDTGATHVWTWDARRWPDFPRRRDVWADGVNHRAGHWLTGRVGAAGLAETVAEICRSAGLEAVDVAALHGLVEGYALDVVQSARAALQPLMLAHGFDAVESGGVLRFVPRGRAPVATVLPADLVAPQEGAAPALTRAAREESPAALRLLYLDADADYRVGVADTQDGTGHRVDTVETTLLTSAGAARTVLRRWQAEAAAARDTASFTLPLSAIALEPGDVLRMHLPEGDADYRIDRVTLRAALEIEATRVAALPMVPAIAADVPAAMPPAPATPPVAVVLDLPTIDDRAPAHQPRLAVHASPWRGALAVYAAPEDDGYARLCEVSAPATLGTLVEPLHPARPGRWWRGSVAVDLWSGRLDTATRRAVLDGANLAAVEAAQGLWEVLQFSGAQLEGRGRWRLEGLLRGQAGTEALAETPIAPGARFVLLDAAVTPLPLPVSALGAERHLRIGPSALGFDDPAFVHLVTTPSGIGLRPFAPAHGAATPVPGGVELRWVRRSRLDADRWLGDEPPLGEDAERYRLRLFDGQRLLREAVTTTPAFLYADSARQADNPAGPVTARIAQLSALVGPGPELEIVIDG